MKAAWSFGALGLIALALVVPGPRESAAPAGGRVISMGHEMFGRSVITIRVGDHLNFSNGSAWLHVLVPGRGARQDSQPGMPRLGPRDAHLSEHGDRWITGAWNVPGTYFITCQLHPEMLLEVRVLPATSTARSASSASALRAVRPNA
jgi:plastocyanin